MGRSLGNRKRGYLGRMLRRSVNTPLDSSRRGRRAPRPLDSSNLRPAYHVATNYNDDLAQTVTHDDNNDASGVSANDRDCRRSDHDNYGRAETADLRSSACTQQSV
jgi:hypothetical protein